ncbi:MAG: hypothetical protein R3D68_06540 [Hyphomicrobiaceae bacterium]
MEKTVMGAHDDVGGLGERFLALISAKVELTAEMDRAAAIDLAATLLDRMLDLEGIERGLGVEAHALVWLFRRGVG